MLKANTVRIFNMQLRFFSFLAILSVLALQAQPLVDYSVNISLNPDERNIFIQQKVRLASTESTKDTLYFNDWNNAYSSAKTPLAKRFAEEFDRRFYLAPKNRLGYTSISSIILEKKDLQWFRPKNHPDIIGVVLPEERSNTPTITLEFRYRLHLPDARFTGYGFNDNDKAFQLSDWLITYTGTTGDWISNLNIDDAQLAPAHYILKMTLPEGFQAVSDLPQRNDTLWEGDLLECPEFQIAKSIDFFRHRLNDGTIVFSDIDYNNQQRAESKDQFERIYQFFKSQLPLQGSTHFLVTKHDYNERPFYGLNQLPNPLSPFTKSLLNELKIVKAFARAYVQSQLLRNKRKEQWLLEGLPIYLVIKYMEAHYPDLRFMGSLSEWFYIRTYGIAKMKFNEGFMTYTEFALRDNRHQKASSPKNVLTRFNERIAVPYHVGIGLRYLESYLGPQDFDRFLTALRKWNTTDELSSLFQTFEGKSIDWFYTAYIDSRWRGDFSINYSKTPSETLKIRVKENHYSNIPFALTYLKNKKAVAEKWMLPSDSISSSLSLHSFDQIAVNPTVGLPELNKENNWKSTNGGLLKKTISLKLVKDIEVPDRSQVFANPLSNYNAYDGISLGLRFHNKKLTRQNVQVDLRPQYSFLESNLVGSYSVDMRFNSMERKNYLTSLSFSGASFHYAEGLRYNVLAPRLTFLFRTPDFRSNVRQAISASWYNISKDLADGIDTSPEYSVFKLQHLYSDRAAINYLTLATDLELANSFSKMSFNADFRKLFPSGRQIQARFFAGTFFSNQTQNNGFFDFSLTRPNDYLYQYNYLGRSETTGIYSQQFILAEGGIKSPIDTPNVSHFLISTNFMLSVWKWIELYGDVALAKNNLQPIKNYWGTGIRINFVPDYLELYFPVYSHRGFELDQKQYFKSMRFVLTIAPKQLATLFTRKWF